MARKKKVEETPITTDEPPVEVEPSNPVVSSETVTIDVSCGLSTDSDIIQATWRINTLLQEAYEEIKRCDDYIEAYADTDRAFATYRKELYEYRYKLRQLIFDPNYPDMSKMKFPPIPVRVPDQ